MKIYVDLIFFMNFFYDYLLLLFLGLILKRNINHFKIGISSFIGALSFLTIFLNLNNYVLYFIKIITSIAMVIISFKYISFKYTINNLIYLYMLSVILAGMLYYLNIQSSYEHIGIFYYFKGISPTYYLLIIISPIILLYEYYCHKKGLIKYNYYYHLDIFFNKHKISCMGYLDTGNNLIDPITGKPIIIVNQRYLKGIDNIRSPVLVPYNTLNSHSLMKCYKPSYIIINNHKIYNYLIGEANISFKDGIGALLNNSLRKDNYV